jgi:hypothetical protein
MRRGYDTVALCKKTAPVKGTSAACSSAILDKETHQMKKAMIVPVLLVCIGLLSVGAHATVEWQSMQTIELAKELVDVAVTPDGRWAFALTAEGDVLIYSAAGKLEDTLHVGGGFDRIACSASGDRIYLSNRAAGRLQIVEIEFVKEIDTAGSPFLGPPKAPVTVVVFSEFQ